MALKQTMTKIHVLLVDHEYGSVLNTHRLLEICEYKVTFVKLASMAIQMLTNGKAEFDMVMANSNSPDLHAPKLVQHAVGMDLPIILMSNDEDVVKSMEAIEKGAFMCMKKPATIEMIKCMWQHVAREKMRVMKEREMVATFNEPTHEVEVNSEENADLFKMENEGKAMKRDRPNEEMNVGDENYDSGNDNKHSKKVFKEWTQELHAKFINAVAQLGEGKCFPKEILELMNMPGLTRMQVASHLQKCRNDAWRPREERMTSQPLGSDGEGSSQSKTRRFGSMPRLGKFAFYPSYGLESSAQTHSETEADGYNERNGSVHTTMENSNISHHHQPNLGNVFQPAMNNATPNNISTATSNRGHSSDDFFNFPVMDNLVQDYPRMTSQGYHAMNLNVNPHNGSYHFDPVYASQNPTVPSTNGKSPWNSQRSSFGSNETNTKQGK